MLDKLKDNWLVILIGGLILALAIFLRFYKLTQVPPSPYWEEAALGYDAYSISQTLKDHHGHFLPLISFESFGDYKPSGYFYVLALFVKLLGLKVLIVRLPSALAGLSIVLGVATLTWILLKQTEFFLPLRQALGKYYRWFVVYVALFISAVSSWGVMFSRAAWEANLATAFLLWGVITFYWFKLKQRQANKLQYVWLLITSFLFAYSMYTYHAARVVAPLLLLFLMLEFLFDRLSLSKRTNQSLIKRIKAKRQALLVIFGLGLWFLVLASPLISGLSQKSVNDRFKTTSVFNNMEIIKKSNQLRQAAGYSLPSRLFYHRDVLYTQEILTNFFKHLDLDFLFVHGDKNHRHSTGYLGQLYWLDFFFILFAIYGLWRWQKRVGLFLLVWLVISIIPSSLTLEGSPHALRILPGLPAWQLLVSFGVLFLANWLVLKLNRRWFFMVMFSLFLVYSLQVVIFWRFYTQVYPKLYSADWQYGYQAVMNEVSRLEESRPNYDVYISRQDGRPAMYYWFYNQTDPREVQAREDKEKKASLQNEFLTYKNKTFFDDPSVIRKRSVLAIHPDELDQTKLKDSFKVTKVIKDLQGKPIWLVGVVE